MTAVAMTPTVRATARRWLFWVLAGGLALLIALGVLATAGSTSGGRALDPENPGPAGTMALVEVLRDRGVQVVITHSLATTRTATSMTTASTLVIDNTPGILDEDKLAEAVELAETTVVFSPSFGDLLTIAPDVAQAGWVSGTVEADCDLRAVQRAGAVSVDGDGYRVIGDTDATTCLASDPDVFSLVGLERENRTLWILGALTALTNEHIIDEGNAAFALGLLGQNPRLVWYQPSFDDVDAADTISELSPPWVVPVMVLLALTFVLAAIWRGRRFGPLVVENLPVTVRASETMQGRARLYAQSSARLRALDALRVGTIQRLAAHCGLASTATVDEVVAAVANLTGAGVDDLRRLLVDVDPPTDRDLVAYSDALLDLERDVAARIRP